MLGGADNPNGELPSYITGADTYSRAVTSSSARKWTNSGAMSGLNRASAGWFYAYDSLRKTVVAHVFGERTMATLGRLMSLLSPFDVVIWMTDGWPLYESRLKGKLHVISKRYTQRIERHNLNLRQHLARLGRKSLSFSKSVELHDKVIGHYLNIKHYQ
ncbi:IS1 transposase [Shigella sonnei]|nr:IS1 transposase [Shigella sonnei]